MSNSYSQSGFYPSPPTMTVQRVMADTYPPADEVISQITFTQNAGPAVLTWTWEYDAQHMTDDLDTAMGYASFPPPYLDPTSHYSISISPG